MAEPTAPAGGQVADEVRAFLDAAMRFTASYGPARPRLLAQAAGYGHAPGCDLDIEREDDGCVEGCQRDAGFLLWMRAYHEQFLINCGKVDDGLSAYRPRGEEPAVDRNGCLFTPEAAREAEQAEQAERLVRAIFGDDDEGSE